MSLVATNAAVSQILDEWAFVGGTRIVNGERAPGDRVTLQLADVPEREALDLLLRSAAGYVAAQRAEGSAAASRFALAMILPTSVAAFARGPAGGRPLPRQPSVSCPVNILRISRADFRDWQGAATRHSTDYGEEPQRRQARKDAAK